MKVVTLLAVVLLSLSQAALAQEAGEKYHSNFRELGFKMRATYACPIDKKKALRDIGNSATADSKAFAQAFPKTVQTWMEEGADLFNAGVMKDGITSVCDTIH